MKFCKKPVIIEATQWFKNGDHPEDNLANELKSDGTPPEGEVVRYFRRPDVPSDKICEICGHFMEQHGWIDMLECGHVVCPGDYVITSIRGEEYPCNPDIFETTYEPA